MNEFSSSTFIEIFNFDSWKEFTDEFSECDTKLPYIYRGQSNYFDGTRKQLIEWQLASSFNRRMSNNQWSFKSILSEQYSNLFDIILGDYRFSNINIPSNSTLLEKIYLFQHYGIPTCFIDFTYHPLIALYFSLSEIILPGVKKKQFGNLSNFNRDAYFSIYQLNYELLNKKVGIKKLDNSCVDCQFLEPQDYHKFEFEIGGRYFNTFLDLDPKSSILNNNLVLQKSCFLCFDNEHNISFEEFLKQYEMANAFSLDEPILKIFNIKYNSIIDRLENHNNDVFKYLIGKEITGKYLFDDIQGLKYDFFNFFDRY